MAQFWIAVFFILLAIAQLVQSIKAIDLPFSVYLVLGMVLAVAANPRAIFAFVPTPPVTLPEIAAPAPAIAATDRPAIAATDLQNVTPATLDAIEPKPKRTRKTAPKSSLSSTPEPPDALGAIDNSEPKPKRTRKATAKSPQA
jgi:hypothetical protein